MAQKESRLNYRSLFPAPSARFPIPYSLLPLLVLLAACSPFSDDGDGEAAAQPTATRVFTIITIPPDATVPPEEATETAEARATEGIAAATARAAIATPTANPIPTTEEGTLVPPQARLVAGSQQALAEFGSYSWQFDDQAASFIVVEAPTVFLGEEITVQTNDTVSLDIFGDALRALPIAVEVAAYDYEKNQGTPINPDTGQPADEVAFAVKTDPEVALTLSRVEQPFTLEDLAPGHYALRVQGRWGPHPMIPDRQIFVTWVFNVMVT